MGGTGVIFFGDPFVIRCGVLVFMRWGPSNEGTTAVGGHVVMVLKRIGTRYRCRSEFAVGIGFLVRFEVEGVGPPVVQSL